MCGRYALALPPWRVRQLLQDANMPVHDAPHNNDDDEDDDDHNSNAPTSRQSYNFAPGYYGLVYRQDAPDHGAASSSAPSSSSSSSSTSHHSQPAHPSQPAEPLHPHYKLQAMQWGLVPFWTKRRPDYANILRTINCRDDSLATPGGMWHTMKQKKRCIVLAQGFFEWLKKNDGKDKLPHYIKRTDGQLMCFAGLWDCVKYQDRDDTNYTYTIITTDANKQINFLHDRMPVIFDNGSEHIFTWLDSTRSEWDPELQSLLKPYSGDLEIYPVTKDMNKAGSSSPNFTIPLDDSKQSISHFFGKKHQSSSSSAKTADSSKPNPGTAEASQAEQTSNSSRAHASANCSPPSPTHTNLPDDVNEETNAPAPTIPAAKRHAELAEQMGPRHKIPKHGSSKTSSPTKLSTPLSSKKSKSAISNASVSKQSPSKANQKITSFFGK